LYDSIYTAWKREKDSEEIQPLPKDFFQKASEYLSELKLSLSEQNKESATRSAKERETGYVEFMLLGLLRMRAKKMLSLPLTDLELSPNFLENEFALVDDLRKGLKRYLEKPILQTANPEKTEKNHLGGEALATTSEKNPSDFMLLRMLQPIPRLVGVDLDEYGPFQPEDLVALPRENALALIARGVALEVKPSSYQETGGSES
jgi:DNA replication initiation complex subunit (GINS family)